MRNAGTPVAEIAETFGVHISTVYGWLKRGTPPMGETAEALERLLAGTQLDARGEFNAAVARSLAAKLDEARTSVIAAVAMAAPSIAKELRTVVEDIMGTTEDTKGWVADIFAGPEVDDTEEPGT